MGVYYNRETKTTPTGGGYKYEGVYYETYAEASAAMRDAAPPRGGTSASTTESDPELETETDPETTAAAGSLISLQTMGPLQSRILQKHWLYTRNIIRPRRAWM